MNIEQIAQEVREEMADAVMPQVVGAYEEAFLRRCLSKLAEQAGEPFLWTTRALIGTSTMCDENYPVPLYTEAQLIAAQQRTAEACAKVCNSRAAQHASETREDEADKCADSIRNGEWREYL